MTNSYRIMGIDPGTRITGYGIIACESASMHLIDFGSIQPPSHLSLSKRYLIIYNALETLIKKYHPSVLSVENQFFQKNAQSTLKLGMAKACAFIAGAKNNLPVYEYPPKKAKLAVAGTGRASKYQVVRMIQLILNLSSPPAPEDAADALSLAICHAHAIHKTNFIKTRGC